MALVSGTTLGPYEILAPLGAGGMGEVYRARDRRLERTVAIKVLPSAFSRRPELRKRLEREARMLSSLSHPHICALYDVGQQDGTDFLVMEFLEGETLAHRLVRGALPAAQLLKYGSEVADALGRAHQHGIIHRDLKPGNIMLTKDGAKLLDFGLARLDLQAGAAAEALTRLDSHSLTEDGVILGTFQYMAPEQLEGKDADARTDVFALGAVLYEMATAKAAFQGKTRASLIAAILASQPPPISSLQPLTPPALERVVKTCLAKDPDDRWQSAPDVKLQLEWIAEGGSQAGVPIHLVNRRKLKERASWLVAALLGLLALAFGVGYWQRGPISPDSVTFNLGAPEGYSWDVLTNVSVAPNGKALVFAVADPKGKPVFWYRKLDSLEARRLEDVDDVQMPPIWSPDSRFLYYAKPAWKLYRLSGSSRSELVCESLPGDPTDINQDGVLLLGSFSSNKGILSARIDDCSSRTVIPQEQSEGYLSDHFAFFLPDGKHFIFTNRRSNKRHNVMLGALDSNRRTLLLRNASRARYVATGFLVFHRQGLLMAVKFDSRSLLITGDPFPIFEQPVIHANLGGWAEYSVSSNGNILAYRLELPLSVSLQKWTQSGEKVAEIGKMGPWGNQRLSPDGRQLLAVHFDVNHVSDIWRITLEDGNWQRETKQGCAGTTPPAWDPDGKRFAYSCVLESKQEIYIKSLGDPGNGRLLAIAMPANKQVIDWSPDGHFLLVRVESYGPDGTDGIYRVPLEPDSKPVLLIEDKTSDGIARLSPDGKWIAYVSDQSGAPEVYVRGIEKDSPVSQISSGGGYDPAWQRDGKAVYFRTGTFGIMRVTAKPGVATRFSTPTALFQLPTGSDFTPAEGGGFIVASSEGQVNTPITILANWRILPPDQ